MSDADYPPQSDSRPASGGDPYQSPPSRGQMLLGGSAGYPYPPAGDAPTNPSLWAGDPSAPHGVPYAGVSGMPHAYGGPPSGNYPPGNYPLYPGSPTTPLGYPPTAGYGGPAPRSVPLGAPPSGGYPGPYPPVPPQTQGLGAGAIVAIVLGSILLVCIALCALGVVVNAMTGAHGSRSPFTFTSSTPTPTETPWSLTYVTPTPVSGVPSGGPGGAFPTATAAPVHVPPVPANCCYNMTLGQGWGRESNGQLYITGRTNNFHAGDTFAYLVNLNGHPLVANNKPAGSTHFWLYLLRPTSGGGEVVVSKDTQDLSGPNASTDTECANSFSMINLMQQEPAGQYKVEFVTADGTTYLGAAIFDYFG